MANHEVICKASLSCSEESVNYEVISTFWLHDEINDGINLATGVSEGIVGAREAALVDSLAPAFCVVCDCINRIKISIFFAFMLFCTVLFTIF